MSTVAVSRPATSNLRWIVCALLFFATTINYVDRQVLSILAKTLETSIGWDSIQYGFITAAFQAAYAIGLLCAGRLIDRLGTRTGYAIAVAVWSFAAIAHSAAVSAFTFGIARALLGLGEAANFPACIKTVAEWFPKSERALATGIFNSGANIGAVVAPLVVPWLAVTYGWQSAFIATGALGFLWLAFWLLVYHKPEEHPGISARELGYIQSDPPDKATSYPWAGLFPKRETWAFAIGKGMTDPVWWFYLFWFPKYLQETFGLTLQQIVLPTLVVYNICSIGSIGGGWLSSGLIQRGWSVNSARKTAMLICAIGVVPVLYAPYSKSLWVVVALVGLATAAHQGWSANLFTTVSDMFPRAAVGSVVGIGGTLGAVASVGMQIGTGYIVQLTHSYLPLFLIAGSAYLVALAIIHSLSPKLAPAELD
ncbi:MAG TPA: MFS transporter [Bryobacteraceae bacterium]|jgi:ACS family hexuronate transporter-like MFS transporter|nr:MFS transporter [Bryobacteraceae bacterium]